MLLEEFEKKTNIFVPGEYFDLIHQFYMNTEMDKDQFCKGSRVVSKREAFRGFFFMHEKRSLNWLLKKLPLLSHSMSPERPDLHTGYFEIKDI